VLDKAVSQRRFTVIDVGNDREISNVIKFAQAACSQNKRKPEQQKPDTRKRGPAKSAAL
jgi:hypothetical protein